MPQTGISILHYKKADHKTHNVRTHRHALFPSDFFALQTKSDKNTKTRGKYDATIGNNRQLNTIFAVRFAQAPLPYTKTGRKYNNKKMNDIYSKEVVDFVKVSADYCLKLENCRQVQPSDFVKSMLSVLPYIYIKATVLLDRVCDNGLNTDAQVTEEDYNYIRLSVYDLLGQYDEYLDVFVEDMKYSDRPVLRTISEDLADIYQDLRDFLAVYREGIDEMSEAALYKVMDCFRQDWGQKCVNVMRPLHDTLYKQMEEEHYV